MNKNTDMNIDMNRRRLEQGLRIVLIVGLALVVTACAPRNTATPAPGAEPAVRDSAAPLVEQAAVEAPAVPAPAEGEAGRAVDAAVEGLEAPAAVEESYGAAGGGLVPLPTAAAEQGSPVVPPDQPFRGPLQAGMIDDNARFGEYLQYRHDFQVFLGLPVHDRDVSERHRIDVRTRGGRPVLGAEVLIYDGQRLAAALRTTATGSVYFFPRAYPAVSGAASYNVVVSKGQTSQSFTLTRGSADSVWEVTLDVAPARPPVRLDVLFLIDATGSMSDEINELKDNILSISAQIKALPGSPDVRYGLVYYRDRGDEYVTRVVDFTGDVQAFQRDLMNVYASGGGDTPESLNEALHDAVNRVSWRVDDTVSLIFLVADAPPHLDYPQDFSYAEEMMVAAELGIKIFPIGSRLDGEDAYQKQAEYIFRQLAQFTGGSFIFLTYQDTPQSSGEPGTEYSIPEDRYSVEDLDALVVRLVQQELEALTAGQ